MRILILVLMLAECACAGMKMSPDNNVRLANETQVASCQLLNVVSSSVGGNFGTFEGNVEQAVNELREKAYRKGATHMVVKSTDKEDRGAMGNCNNCVSAMGEAYRCPMGAVP